MAIIVLVVIVLGFLLAAIVATIDEPIDVGSVVAVSSALPHALPSASGASPSGPEQSEQTKRAPLAASISTDYERGSGSTQLRSFSSAWSEGGSWSVATHLATASSSLGC